MNTSTPDLAHPDAAAFVAAVRARFSDLNPDERDELLYGLEADLRDQLADGVTLGDPVAYADELRAAAGLPPARLTSRLRLRKVKISQPVDVLDWARERWDAFVVSGPKQATAWDLVSALQPAWWVFRAWLLVSLLDMWSGNFETVSLVPSLAFPGLGLLVLAIAIVLSTLLGQKRLFPAAVASRPTTARFALLGINTIAIFAPFSFNAAWPGHVAAPWERDSASYNSYNDGYRAGKFELRGLDVDGKTVRNIFAYSPGGRPLTGVQLFDQDGRPIAVSAKKSIQGNGATRTVGCPAYNGGAPLFNVYPLAERQQRKGTCLDTPSETDGTTLPATPPLASVPPAVLPIQRAVPTEAPPIKKR